MYGDSHFHLSYLDSCGIDTVSLLRQLAQQDVPFLLDIGTHCDDLSKRIAMADGILTTFSQSEKHLIERIQKNLYFSAGIWPAAEAIQDRYSQIAELEHQITSFLKKGSQFFKPSSFIAIGECGLDHHWNVDGPDNRDKSDFDQDLLRSEKEMFEMHINLAKKYGLPVIVHSRDAFLDTLDCIKREGYHNGIIHCYSYGLEEVKPFLEMGWYISFSGSVTYAKKNKMEGVKDLLRYIPKDRLLVETDSPYLAPVPNRGKTNTPLFIKDTYSFVSQALCMDVEGLSSLVTENFKTLFGLL